RFTPSSPIPMFKHYLKVSWRNLVRQKMYAIIKIGGFSIGIALFVLISLFVRDELRVDQHYENGDRLFRILYANSDPTSDWSRGTSFPAPITYALKDHFPDIEKAGRLISFQFYDSGSNLFRPTDEANNIFEEGFVYADQELIEILEIPMVYGSRDNALSEPNSILISKRKANKYFPNQNPVGKTIILNDGESSPYVIGGVMENLKDSHLSSFDFFITLSGKEFWEGEQTGWNGGWVYSPYIRVRPGTDSKELEKKLSYIHENYVVKTFLQEGDQRADSIRKYGSIELQPVGDIHLKSHDVSDFLAVSDIRIVKLFSAIGIFILLLACINFINLSTAKSAKRAKEIGLRKAIGSRRSNLIHQFLSESIFVCAISVLLGAFLAWISIPQFNLIAGKEIVFPLSEWWFVPVLALLTLVIGLIAGVYPSIYLSGFRPISVLSGNVSKGSQSPFFRSGLVIFQFMTSIVLIVGAFIVHQQMQFILNKELGFDKEQVLMIHGTNTLKEQLPEFKNELLRLSEVEYATVSDFFPVQGTYRNGDTFWKEGRSKVDEGVSGQIWSADPDYLDAMGMKLVEGRIFSLNMNSDSASILVNQKLVKELVLENPVGERITFWGQIWTIVGVIEDFHFDVMKDPIRPLALRRSELGTITSVKVNTQDMEATLTGIRNIWDQFKPNQPIRYTFLDESYARMYDDVGRTSKIFTAFAILAILVACLGLFALSAFMLEQRSKEISIRKVLGASLKSIFNLVTIDFLRPVFIGFLMAVPIGWYMMNRWLEDYTYRIEISWGAFAFAGGTALLIALLTISIESIKAALADPVENLRSE
ncbi:MAG: ABC transporter permease, partial [Bacteroidota bacterium]